MAFHGHVFIAKSLKQQPFVIFLLASVRGGSWPLPCVRVPSILYSARPSVAVAITTHYIHQRAQVP